MPHPGLEHVKRESAQGLALWDAAQHVRPAGPPKARAGHPTQELAAAKAAPKAKGKRLQVLTWIAGQGNKGATDHETAAALGFPLQTVCARRNELLGTGLVQDSGKTRKTPYGCAATVWVSANNANER